MKVLITGAAGQLGWELQRTVLEGTEIVAVDVAELDIGDQSKVEAVVQQHKPNVIINAAAYTAVDKAESEQQLAYRVNADGVANLAHAAKSIDARLIQVSTDFIFDGTQATPYRTDSVANPLSVYGASKYQGEQQVLSILAEQATIVRTAWVYSSHGANFVKTMLRLMAERDQLGVVDDQIGTPTWARGLAEAIWHIVDNNITGIYHWTDAGVASWYDFAIAIQSAALARGLLTKQIPINPIRTSDYPTPAKRPGNSILDKHSTWQKLSITSSHWSLALSQMLDELSE